MNIRSAAAARAKATQGGAICPVCVERPPDATTDTILCAPCARSFKRVRGNEEAWLWAARRARSEERRRWRARAKIIASLPTMRCGHTADDECDETCREGA